MDGSLFKPRPSIWSRTEKTLRAFEPVGILIAAVALVVTAWQFLDDREERRESREVQRQTLHALAWLTLDNARGKTFNAGAVEAIFTLRTAGFDDFSGIDLGHTWLVGVDFAGANLANATLVGARLENADLRKTNLGAANLSQAKLNGSKLEAADLTAADLSEADLRDADLSQATLDQACVGAARPATLPVGLRQPPPCS